MTSLIKSLTVLVAGFLLFGCMAHQLGNNMLETATKSNEASCRTGYRDACLKLFLSGCKNGSNSTCRSTVAAQSEVSNMLNDKCEHGDKGACFTLVSISCKKGDASACNTMNMTEPLTLDDACKNGDQLACSDPPPGVKNKPIAVILNNP